MDDVLSKQQRLRAWWDSRFDYASGKLDHGVPLTYYKEDGIVVKAVPIKRRKKKV